MIVHWAEVRRIGGLKKLDDSVFCSNFLRMVPPNTEVFLQRLS